MIYYLYCGLIMSGYSACSALLGSYMMYYTGATEIDLGLIFMVQPLTVFLRPLICARADRYQSHQSMLSFFCIFTSLAYFPFIIYPFFHNKMGGLNVRATPSIEQHMETNEILADLSIAPEGHIITPEQARIFDAHQESLRYWLLIVFHLLGSIGWCGVRSLGDALACNYAKRIGTDFARYRKYGSISYGLCNVSLGFINQDWVLPNFVPSLMVYSASMIVLAILVWAWPSQYFIMTSKNYDDPRVRQEYIDSLPSSGETARHLSNRLLFCGPAASDQECRQRTTTTTTTSGALEKSSHFGENLTSSMASSAELASKQKEKHLEATGGGCNQGELVLARSSITSTGGGGGGFNYQQEDDEAKVHALSVRQQMQIFGLLLKRDFRILLYLLVIFYGGLVGYTGPNFVFTYINVVCIERGTCNGSELCGLVISGHCFIETIVYMLVDKFRNVGQNRVLMLEITFLSLSIHYYFYGFAIEHLSPYFFLIESLHGIEYGISLSQSVELGYYFAREVELLLPELIERRIISDQDDKELVKKSLMATLSGCYTMAYEGVGTIVGCLMMGMVTGHFGFIVTWITIGSLSAIGFVLILLGYLIGKCFKIRPEILRIRDRQVAAAASAASARGSAHNGHVES